MSDKLSPGGLIRLYRLSGGAVAVVGYLFLILPSVIVIPISFGGRGELTFPPRAFSWDLYADFFTDPAWWGTAVQSLQVATLTTILAVVLAAPASYALVRGTFPGKQVLSIVLLSPILIPLIVLGLGLYLHFASLGIVGSTLSLVLAHTVLVTPFVMVSISSGLRHIDPALERAATIMGAGHITIFFGVVFPQIKASIAVGALFAFLISFDEVIVAYFISGADTMTLPVKMFSAIRWEISPVIAAVSTLLTALSLVFCVAIMFLQKQDNGSSQ
ncbi:ABC transporter permease [Rhodospirillaceae bacterium KN72]|uniref:ABC transporter permease n=1 Tax=Pacificispira spongiicola TaxID=2729598 RepID=A0A7Y0DX75_9PROT|nr:ABC transporter permease [Pacificispira spongiicola]NMM43113.1 ABC transporter permease [Pacificispira spongiicola]